MINLFQKEENTSRNLFWHLKIEKSFNWKEFLIGVKIKMKVKENLLKTEYIGS